MSDNQSHSSDWAVILGVSSGFGAATARALAKRGLNIYGVHLDRRSAMKNVDALITDLCKEGVEVIFHNMSATDPIKKEEVIRELKAKGEIRVKILLHTLAFGGLRPFITRGTEETITQKQIDMTLDVMANSLVYWVQELFKTGFLQAGSHIFAMTSSGGHSQWKNYGAISGAKAALESYCRQLALELSPHKIACNALQAGVTDTPALRKIPGNEEMIRHALKVNPAGRLTLPEDIAKAVAMLGLSEDTWLTGNTIRVDGGEDITG